VVLVRRRVRAGYGVLVLTALTLLAVYGALAPGSGLYGPVVSRVPTDRRLVAITFDDGPDPRFTPPILDLLRRHRAHATFFVCGQAAGRYPGLVRRMAAQGHEIGNHTYHHRDLLWRGPGGIREELASTQRVLARCGVHCRLVRPPYGFRTPLLSWQARRLGLEVVTWSVATGDWLRPGAGTIADRALARLAPGQVILLHDGRGDRRQTVAALEVILAELARKGYRCVTVTQLQGAGLSPR